MLVVAALLAGLGHGYRFIGAEAELNAIARAERRGEVTAAFATCIYLGVASSVIGVGVVAHGLSVFAAVGVYAAVVVGAALAAAGWHPAEIMR